MSFGSDTYGGAAEGINGVSFGSSPIGGEGNHWDYSLGTGTTPGLQVAYDSTPGYTFGPGTTPGFNPGNYDISGGLGRGLVTGGYSPAVDYSLGSMTSFANPYADGGSFASGVGLSATPSLNPVSLGQSSLTTPFSAKEEPGFWGSRAQKALSFLANFNPMTSIFNAGAQILNSQDPVKAAIQGLLGKFGGDVGQLANVGYNVATSKDPMASAMGTAGAMVGGQVGGSLAGSPGAQLGSAALGGLLAQSASLNPAYGPYGTRSIVADMAARGPAPQGTQTEAASPGGGGGRNWTDTAMSLLSGIYGMKQANAQRALAQEAAAGSRVANAQLQKVAAGDFAGDAGYEAALKAAARASAQQPGGFAASAAAQAALKYQNDRIATLSGAAQPGYATALNGTTAANNLASASLGSMGFGVSQGTQMPPWLQAYLVKNGMAGASNG